MTDKVVYGGEAHSGRPTRALFPALMRGFACRCPRCGEGRLFHSFLKVVDRCEACGEDFHHHRADDLPAYLVVFVVGHIVVGSFMGVESVGNLTLVQHLMIWVPVTIILALALLQPVKGAVVGLQWAYYMHGFGGTDDRVEDHPELDPDVRT